MFKKLTLAGAAFAMGAASLIPATPAMAQRYDRGASYDSYDYRGERDFRSDRGFRGNDNRYRGRSNANYRARQKCADGDGGMIVGALVGGVAGHEIAGRGDRTIGAILGGAVGALAGRAIDRSDRPNYCR